jgi:hypothetical protein
MNQSVNTGLRLNCTTPALTLVVCRRACKPLDYEGKHSRKLPSDTSLPDFYARFEANSPNGSTDDAISIALHTALPHLDKSNTYVRMLFIDYS